MSNYNVALTVSIMGSSKVGKTLMSKQFLKRDYPDQYKPTIFEMTSILYRYEDIIIDLSVQDTGGEKKISGISIENFWNQWIIDSDAFILVYDSTKKSSFEFLQKIIAEIKKIKKENTTNPNVPFFPMIFVSINLDKNAKKQIELAEAKKSLLTTLNLKDAKEFPWIIELNCDNSFEKSVDDTFNLLIKSAIQYKKYSLDTPTGLKPQTLDQKKRSASLKFFNSIAEDDEPPRFKNLM